MKLKGKLSKLEGQMNELLGSYKKTQARLKAQIEKHVSKEDGMREKEEVKKIELNEKQSECNVLERQVVMNKKV